MWRQLMFLPDWEQRLHDGQWGLLIGRFRNKGSFTVCVWEMLTPNWSSEHSKSDWTIQWTLISSMAGQHTHPRVQLLSWHSTDGLKTSYVVKNDLDSWHKDNWVWLSQSAKFRGKPAAIEAIQGHTASHTTWQTERTQTDSGGWDYSRWLW